MRVNKLALSGWIMGFIFFLLFLNPATRMYMFICMLIIAGVIVSFAVIQLFVMSVFDSDFVEMCDTLRERWKRKI